MNRKILGFCIFLSYCSVNGCAAQEEECSKSFVYPLAIVNSESTQRLAEEVVGEALLILGLEERDGKFYFQESSCYVQTTWMTNTKLTVVPFLNDSSSISATEFSDRFQGEMNKQLAALGLVSQITVSEEIILQE